jgi:hypothetical protein
MRSLYRRNSSLAKAESGRFLAVGGWWLLSNDLVLLRMVGSAAESFYL